ncbi:MAG: sialidase family protein [Thermoplasmatota archaeon]
MRTGALVAVRSVFARTETNATSLNGRVAFVAALAFVITPLLAGCIAAPKGPGTDALGAASAPLACIADVCNFQATVDPTTRQANELSVAVNPKDPLNIIATGKDYTPDQAGQCVWAGIYATKDGGKTWKDGNVPGSPWARLKDPTLPMTPFSNYWCATDPVVAFGPDGTAYWIVQPYQCDPVSGSKTGRGVVPGVPGVEGGGGFNDWAYTCSAMFVLVSTDGGLTWPVDKARDLGAGAGGLPHDKPWLAVSPDGGKVLACWDYGGPESTTTDPTAPYTPADGGGVVCTVSKDHGDTWSRFTVATTVGGFPWLDFDASGRAWMSVAGGDNAIYVLSSDDGQKWSEATKVAAFKQPTGKNEYGWDTLQGSAFRIVPYGSLGVDKTKGANAGRVYVAWFDATAGNGDIMLSSSADGKTWSAPIKVNDDTGAADQFLPALAVGPDGTVDVSWMDRRDDPANHLFTAYATWSLDGGKTFAKNVKVGTALSDEQYSHHQNGMVFLGDYRDSDSAVRGQSTLVWVDTRNHKADVFIATVLRPSANPG